MTPNVATESTSRSNGSPKVAPDDQPVITPFSPDPATATAVDATVTTPSDAADQPAPAVDPDPSPPQSPESRLPCFWGLFQFLLILGMVCFQNAALQMLATSCMLVSIATASIAGATVTPPCDVRFLLNLGKMLFQNAVLQMLVTSCMLVSIATASIAGATVTPPCDVRFLLNLGKMLFQNAVLQMLVTSCMLVSMFYQVRSGNNGSATPTRRTTAASAFKTARKRDQGQSRRASKLAAATVHPDNIIFVIIRRASKLAAATVHPDNTASAGERNAPKAGRRFGAARKARAGPASRAAKRREARAAAASRADKRRKTRARKAAKRRFRAARRAESAAAAEAAFWAAKETVEAAWAARKAEAAAADYAAFWAAKESIEAAWAARKAEATAAGYAAFWAAAKESVDGSATQPTTSRRTTADLPVAKEKRKCWVILVKSRKSTYKIRKARRAARRAARIWKPVRFLLNLATACFQNAAACISVPVRFLLNLGVTCFQNAAACIWKPVRFLLNLGVTCFQNAALRMLVVCYMIASIQVIGAAPDQPPAPAVDPDLVRFLLFQNAVLLMLATFFMVVSCLYHVCSGNNNLSVVSQMLVSCYIWGAWLNQVVAFTGAVPAAAAPLDGIIPNNSAADPSPPVELPVESPDEPVATADAVGAPVVDPRATTSTTAESYTSEFNQVVSKFAAIDLDAALRQQQQPSLLHRSVSQSPEFATFDLDAALQQQQQPSLLHRSVPQSPEFATFDLDAALQQQQQPSLLHRSVPQSPEGQLPCVSGPVPPMDLDDVVNNSFSVSGPVGTADAATPAVDPRATTTTTTEDRSPPFAPDVRRIGTSTATPNFATTEPTSPSNGLPQVSPDDQPVTPTFFPDPAVTATTGTPAAFPVTASVSPPMAPPVATPESPPVPIAVPLAPPVDSPINPPVAIPVASPAEPPVAPTRRTAAPNVATRRTTAPNVATRRTAAPNVATRRTAAPYVATRRTTASRVATRRTAAPNVATTRARRRNALPTVAPSNQPDIRTYLGKRKPAADQLDPARLSEIAIICLGKRRRRLLQEKSGLANLNQSCYQNASLQVLLDCREFMYQVHRLSSVDRVGIQVDRLSSVDRIAAAALTEVPVLTKALSDVATQLQQDCTDPVYAASVKEVMGRIRKPFGEDKQEDAHEFLVTLLNQIEGESMVEGEDGPLAPWGDPTGDFRWTTQYRFKCTECPADCPAEWNCHTADNHRVLSLDFPSRNGGGVLTVQRLLNFFLQPEDIHVKCDKCQKTTSSTKTPHVTDLPNTLILHLKRFERVDDYHSNKINTPVEISPILTLGSQQYKLQSLLHHKGTTVEGGHYFADVSRGGGWQCANDERLKSIDLKDILKDPRRKETVYILVYVRIDDSSDAVASSTVEKVVVSAAAPSESLAATASKSVAARTRTRVTKRKAAAQSEPLATRSTKRRRAPAASTAAPTPASSVTRAAAPSESLAATASKSVAARTRTRVTKRKAAAQSEPLATMASPFTKSAPARTGTDCEFDDDDNHSIDDNDDDYVDNHSIDDNDSSYDFDDDDDESECDEEDDRVYDEDKGDTGYNPIQPQRYWSMSEVGTEREGHMWMDLDKLRKFREDNFGEFDDTQKLAVDKVLNFLKDHKKRRRVRKKSDRRDGYDKHHIWLKSMGGHRTDLDNLIWLTHAEHLLIHLAYSCLFKEWQLQTAAAFMSSKRSLDWDSHAFRQVFLNETGDPDSAAHAVHMIAAARRAANEAMRVRMTDEPRWIERLRLLDQFKKDNGDCNVPQDYTIGDVNLGRWVNNQRTQYKKYMAGEHSHITEDRIDQLKAIGFKWVVVNKRNRDDDLWERTFRLLDEYRKDNGDCKVRQDYAIGDVNLGQWVGTQRTQYKKFMAGESSQITEDRIAALNAIGFKWVLVSGFTRDDDSWERTFRLLDEYRKANGDCKVRRGYVTSCNVKLGRWVDNQRSQYKKYMAGESSSITKDRIDKLKAIGFFQ